MHARLRLLGAEKEKTNISNHILSVSMTVTSLHYKSYNDNHLYLLICTIHLNHCDCYLFVKGHSFTSVSNYSG